MTLRSWLRLDAMFFTLGFIGTSCGLATYARMHSDGLDLAQMNAELGSKGTYRLLSERYGGVVATQTILGVVAMGAWHRTLRFLSINAVRARTWPNV